MRKDNALTQCYKINALPPNSPITALSPDEQGASIPKPLNSLKIKSKILFNMKLIQPFDGVPVRLIDIETKQEFKRFDSISDAAVFLGKTLPTIHQQVYRSRGAKGRVRHGGKIYAIRLVH